MIFLLHRMRQVGLIAALGTVVAVTLAACSGSPTGSTPAAGSSTPAGQGNSARADGMGGARGRGPAAAGVIAAITGNTMQVQNQQTGQVAVIWTASTKFSHSVAAPLSALKAGICVTAIAPSGTDPSATSFTATTIALTSATNGQCGQRTPGGFPSGRRPSGFPAGQRPSGFPSGAPRRLGAVATGKVASVAGSTITVAARVFGSGTTTKKTVLVGPSTKLTTEAPTTSRSLKLGLCVVADGKADSTGTVAAATVRISEPVNGQCGGFARSGFDAGANGGTSGG